MLIPCRYDPAELEAMRAATAGRPLWVYASTHAGEEEIACRLHKAIKIALPKLLTIIVPRHPDRGNAIAELCRNAGLQVRQRGPQHEVPQANDDIYIGDTLGELGLFYRLAPLACIGRSFSDDGGGGHNPLEAARLGCAVLHGPHVQNLAAIYADMDRVGAAILLPNIPAFERQVRNLLLDGNAHAALAAVGGEYAAAQSEVLGRVLTELQPWLREVGLTASGGQETLLA